MTKKIQSIRGMHDYLPREVNIWNRIEDITKRILNNYGYNKVHLPIIEKTALFKRAIGEETDVVKKEMYSFEDRNGESITLRPEGTAGCVRASIEHNLLHNQEEQRLWYIGPMFRRERPQRGRYRQFNQLGVEVFGLQGPDIDAELIILSARWWRELGISKYLSLELNSIGSLEDRARYRDALVLFLKKNREKLDEECKSRVDKNPLRVLDSKNPNVQALLNDAPLLKDYLDDKSHEHFLGLCHFLKENGIDYSINQRLVRGLDYYNHTVFEWVTNGLGSQGSICAGGRYDGLVKQLGGHETPAIGFAMGLERLILLIQIANPKFGIDDSIIIYLVSLSEDTRSVSIKLAERIRDKFPKLKLINSYGNKSNIKKQFILADKRGARFVLVLGESEMASGGVMIKDMNSGEKIMISQENVLTYLCCFFSRKSTI